MGKKLSSVFFTFLFIFRLPPNCCSLDSYLPVGLLALAFSRIDPSLIFQNPGLIYDLRNNEKGRGGMARPKKEQQGEPLDVRAKGFMNLHDSQVFLGVKETTIYRLVWEGRLTKFKINNRTVFSRVQLEAIARKAA
jgi:hypothetical protein